MCYWYLYVVTGYVTDDKKRSEDDESGEVISTESKMDA